VRDPVRWALPGFVLAGPLHLFLVRCHVAVPWPLWFVIAPVTGFIVIQIVRWHFEGRDNGFRSPRRASLQAIIECGNLGHRPDAGDIAYQVYEVVFYQRPDWQALRDHGHRCREHTFLCRGMAVACATGVVLSLLGSGTLPALAILYVLTLPPIGLVIHAKGRQTLAAFELFDRGVVMTHWPLYEATLKAIVADSRAD